MRSYLASSGSATYSQTNSTIENTTSGVKETFETVVAKIPCDPSVCISTSLVCVYMYCSVRVCMCLHVCMMVHVVYVYVCAIMCTCVYVFRVLGMCCSVCICIYIHACWGMFVILLCAYVNGYGVISESVYWCLCMYICNACLSICM